MAFTSIGNEAIFKKFKYILVVQVNGIHMIYLILMNYSAVSSGVSDDSGLKLFAASGGEFNPLRLNLLKLLT